MKEHAISRTLVQAIALFCCFLMILAAGTLFVRAETDNSMDNSTSAADSDGGLDGEDGVISDVSDTDDDMFDPEEGVVSDSSEEVSDSSADTGRVDQGTDGSGAVSDHTTGADNAENDNTAGTITGIVIAIIVAVAVILLIIILIPKKRTPRN